MKAKYLLLLGPVLFVVTIFLLERITPNYDWRTNYISELSLNKYGTEQRVNFVVSGLLISAMAFYLATKSSSSITKIGWWAGIIVGLSMASTGIWNTDVRLATRTTEGIIHEWGYYMGVIGAILICLLVAIGNRKNRLILIYSITEVLFATYMLVWGGNWIQSGIYQRLLLYSMLLWVEVVAIWTMLRL